ncbi:hypothetical protein JOM56_012834 [Amanita muscaria]
MLKEVLRQTFSSERSPTVWRIIPSLEFLIKRWESMVLQSQFREIKSALGEGIKSLKKWYRRVEGTSAAYFICLVLDPNVKNLYCRHKWEPEEYKAGMACLDKVFDNYYIPPKELPAPTEIATTQASTSQVTAFRYGGSFLLEAVQSLQQEEKAAGSPRDELKQYLESGAEPTDNVVAWWGVRTLRL